MAKKILADGTIAYVGTICYSNNPVLPGICKIIRVQGIQKNTLGCVQDLTGLRDDLVLCLFKDKHSYALLDLELIPITEKISADTLSNNNKSEWFVNCIKLRRATKEEKKQWRQK